MAPLTAPIQPQQNPGWVACSELLPLGCKTAAFPLSYCYGKPFKAPDFYITNCPFFYSPEIRLRYH